MVSCFGVSVQKEKAPENQHSKTRTFTLHLLQQATKNFDDKRVIGHGGFGKVYIGVLEDETKVAVKRRNPMSSQGQKEFQVEIELLSVLDHYNLVFLIGYCDEKNEMILVYEYMEKGTLMSHLYGSDKPSLSWKQRLEVCVGAAKGLEYLHGQHYLHTGSAKAIIHRDIKSANILLDEQYRAKVGDFGISKTGPDLDQTHVTTQVKGSFGYLDPEYYTTQQLTEKSDVYSFGVVLLEILCARPPIDTELPRKEVNLARWGMEMLKKGQLGKIIDKEISAAIRQDHLELFGKIVAKCLSENSAERPSMEGVLKDLEHVLSLEVEGRLRRSLALGERKASNVPDDLPGPSISWVSRVLDESISAGGHSGGSDYGGSSQLIKQGRSKALTRCPAKIYLRDDP
jgi:serine/threonine protein kinase